MVCAKCIPRASIRNDRLQKPVQGYRKEERESARTADNELELFGGPNTSSRILCVNQGCFNFGIALPSRTLITISQTMERSVSAAQSSGGNETFIMCSTACLI